MKKTPRVLAATLLVPLGLAGLSCSGKDKTPGQLMVSLQTDIPLPKDVDHVQIEVLSFGSVQFSSDYQLGSGALLVPATLGVLAGQDPSRPVNIRVTARKGSKARMLREVVTTVPADRIAMLRIPIQWLCDEMAKVSADGTVESTCPNGYTCISGTCKDSTKDSSTLPTFRPQDVFGGGSGAGEGVCFDTLACFASAQTVAVDPTLGECAIRKPPALGVGYNVALVTASGGDGICGADGCYIPLDESSEFGWVEQGDAIVLPPAVCDRIRSGKAKSIALTTACANKPESVPLCGPWSSVGSGGAKPIPIDTARETACEHYVHNACALLMSCANARQIRSNFYDAAHCEQRLKLQCPRWVQAPGSGFTTAWFQACAQASSGLGSCDRVRDVVPGSALFLACDRPAGTLTDHAPCLFGEQCESGLCVPPADAKTCGMCQPRVPEGGSCDTLRELSEIGSSDPCAKGFSCRASTCKTYASKGGSCNEDSECAPGLRCAATQKVCVEPAQEGAACDGDNPCSILLRCVTPTDGSAPVCAKPSAKEGEVCDSTGVSGPDCALHDTTDPSKVLLCSRPGEPTMNQCTQVQVVGAHQVCDPFHACQPGYFCSTATAPAQCAAYVTEGAACNETSTLCEYPAVCKGGFCTVLGAANCNTAQRAASPPSGGKNSSGTGAK